MNHEKYTTTRDGFVLLARWMRTDLDLKDKHLIVFGLIYGFSQDGESEFYGSLSYIADWVGANPSTIRRVLKELTASGLIRRREQIVNGVMFVRYSADLEKIAEIRGSKETTPPCKMLVPPFQNESTPLANCEYPPSKMQPNNKEENKLENKEESNGYLLRLVDAYHDLCPKMSKLRKLSDKRASSLRARLKEYSEEEVKTVFELAGKSAFLNGSNNRGWKADFDWLLNPNNFLKVIEGRYQVSDQITPTIGSIRQETRTLEKPEDLFG